MAAPRAGPARSHLEAFLFMRTAGLQRRRFAADQEEDFTVDDDRVSLLRREEGVVEAPAWAARVDGLNILMSRAEGRVAQLEGLHGKHLSRPGMEDGDAAEKAIQKLTEETTELFVAAQKQLSALQAGARGLRGARERAVVGNVVTALVARLQGVTERFRAGQASYLRRVEAREQRSSQYFSTFQGEQEDDDGLVLADTQGDAWGRQDLLLMEDQDRSIRRREQEIGNIVQSIQDLNTIFKELATMVSEQGEMVDRIDVNIENASVKVDEGLKQLQQASKMQKKNRKMKCILCLGPSLVLLLLILILVKS
jgi:syntaxin 16